MYCRSLLSRARGMTTDAHGGHGLEMNQGEHLGLPFFLRRVPTGLVVLENTSHLKIRHLPSPLLRAAHPFHILPASPWPFVASLVGPQGRALPGDVLVAQIGVLNSSALD